MLRRSATRWLLCVTTFGLFTCSGGRDRLLADLQSPRPELRAGAVKRLADQDRSDDLVLFTRAAKDPAAMVRIESIAALSRSQDARVVDLLGELLEDPADDVQAQAALALAKFKGDKAKGYLTLQYGHRSHSTRNAIIQALEAAEVPSAMASVVKAEAATIWDRNFKTLKEGELPERIAAAEDLGRSGRAEAVDALLPLLQDSQVLLAAGAVRGLGFAGDPRAVPALIPLLSGNDPQLREATVEAIRRLRDPAARAKLQELALDQSALSSDALRAIISLPPSPETFAALCAIALDAGPEQSLAAGYEARHRGACPTDPILDRLAKQKESLTALRALQGLGRAASAFTPKIVPLLDSTSPQVVAEAALAIAEMGDTSRAGDVLRAYERELKRVEALRADWIPSTLNTGAKPPVVVPVTTTPANIAPPEKSFAGKMADLFRRAEARKEVHRDQSARVWPEAPRPSELMDDTNAEDLKPLSALVLALGKLKAPKALEILRQHATDDSPVLRASAYLGLCALAPEGIASARRGLMDASADVQSATASALREQGAAGQAAIVDAALKLAGDRTPLLLPLENAAVSADTASPLQTLVLEGGAESVLATRILGNAGAKDALPVLRETLSEQTAPARRELLVALGKLGTAEDAPTLAKELTHDNAEIRAAAAEALAHTGGPEQTLALEALSGDYYRRVREAAKLSLQTLASKTKTSARR